MNESYSVEGNIVDIERRKIFKGRISVEGDKIVDILPCDVKNDCFILPGLIDSHVHIESSMLIPSEFAKNAVRHGTVASLCDPHEIANVCGIEGILFMLDNAQTADYNFFFGAPSCVPATFFETSGAVLDSASIDQLLGRKDIFFLSEMMNYPGVINMDKEVIKKLDAARKYKKPIDGHAPGLVGNDLKKYVSQGISTDHESFSYDEAVEKINCGMLGMIREGSAARNFESLYKLIDVFPEKIMLCTDDIHPDDFFSGYIDSIVRRALYKGLDVFNVLKAACINPVKHYHIPVGTLKKNDWADFIVVNNLRDFLILQTYIKGKPQIKNEEVQNKKVKPFSLNNFNTEYINPEEIKVECVSGSMNVIEAFDGELTTKKISVKPLVEHNFVVSDLENDILKLIVVNRYENKKPMVGFLRNFGLKKGALASSISHDSHNIIAVGSNDKDICAAINSLVKCKGGIVAQNSDDISLLPLPVGGLMSCEKLQIVAEKYKILNNKAREFGCKFNAPFMTLSFLSLLVIPEIKLGDRGLFDVNQFKFIPLFN